MTGLSDKCVICDVALDGDKVRIFDPITGISVCPPHESAWKEKRTAVKVYRMNDCDWMAAANMDEAKAAYLQDFAGGLTAEEAFEGVYELTDFDLSRMKYTRTEDDGEPIGKITFRQELDLMIVSGTKFPNFFASTEF